MCIGNVYISVRSFDFEREGEPDARVRPAAAVDERPEEEIVQVPGQATEAVLSWVENGTKQVVRFVDERTDEVVLQIPSDELLKISANISALTEERRQGDIDLES